MKLATLREGGRDGTLVVVSFDLRTAIRVPDIAPTLQSALDDWDAVAPRLRDIWHQLNQDDVHGRDVRGDVIAFDPLACAAPLPRAYQWADGSAYLSHVERVRKARGAAMPPSFKVDPLMYQGCSDVMLGACDPIAFPMEAWGIDFEAEVAVITDDVPMGVAPDDAAGHIKLIMLANDISLRHLAPEELAKGFGFFHAKPPTAFSPVAVSPDSIGDSWDGRKIKLPLRVWRNDQLFGAPDAGVDMNFDFPALIAHAAKTRRLGAGTVIGSGTVSNDDPKAGFACIAEARSESDIPFLKSGERVRIQMLDEHGNDIFGAIDQRVMRI